MMITILDRDRKPIAILENAMKPGYTRQHNQLWQASFTLPYTDEKRKFCQPFNFVEIKDDGKYIGLFRIIPSQTSINEQKTVTYELEHVLATLLDDVLFQYHERINLNTTQVLQYLLDKQTVKYWRLGTVAMTRFFSYKWENENLLSAIFSVPKPFDVQYKWTWDTQSYPWTLNLVEAEKEVSCEIRYAYNMKSLEIDEDPTVIFNRIYPLGYGEGDNQLNIKSVNNGIPYIEDKESIARYGLRSYVWADRRFEDAATLKASAEGLLREWKKPKVSIRGSAADISKITGRPVHELTEGKVARLVHPDLGVIEQRIVKESKSDFKGNPGDVQLEIANATEDISTTTMDLERRQQINELYSQGATNLIAYSYNDNCDQEHPAEITFYLPDEMVRINKLLLTYETDNFRGTTKGAEAGGGTTATSSAGGGTSSTSSSGGGTSSSTSSGGGTSTTSAAGGDHNHLVFRALQGPAPAPDNRVFAGKTSGGADHIFVLNASNGADIHTYGSSGNHSHSYTTPSHSHNFSTPNHSHTFTIQNHVHSVTIQPHEHPLIFGIYKHDKMPTRVTVTVDGNNVPLTDLSVENFDLADYLSKDSEGKVTRGWHTIQIRPNDLARVNANVISQFFIQSRGGEAL